MRRSAAGALFALTLLAGGCAPVHYHPSSAAGLAPEQLATASPRTSLFGPSARIWGVDGERAGELTPMKEVDLAPGPHLLDVAYLEAGFFTQSHSIGTVAVCLVAEPGHRYEVRTASVPAEHFFQLDTYWRPWIVDLASAQVVSGRPARDRDPLDALPATLEVLSLHACWGRGTLDPHAAPRAAVVALARELGGDADGLTCHGDRVQIATGDAPPRAWAERFAAVRPAIQPCLAPGERDGIAAYDHAIARRIVRQIVGAGFFTKQEAEDRSGAAGIGVDLARDGEDPVVVEALAGGPAARAGVVAGDRVVRIGEVATHELPIGDVVDLLHGPKGTTVTLAVARDGGEPRTIAVTRELLQLPPPAAEWVADGIGYVRIRTLAEGTDEKLAEALATLHGARGIVVDLRASAAGPIATAAKVAGLLLPPGRPIVTTVEPDHLTRQTAGAVREGGLIRTESAVHGRELLAGIPVVALTDESASGSAAIVTAAWRTHHRATVIGARPIDDGFVLRWFGLGDAAARLPVGHMLAADGARLADAATPDVPVAARRPLSGRREDDVALARAVASLRGAP